MRVVAPLNGKELMPHMDTGIGIINFDTPTQYTPEQVGEVAKRAEKMVRETTEGLKWVSTTIGSEPGQIDQIVGQVREHCSNPPRLDVFLIWEDCYFDKLISISRYIEEDVVSMVGNTMSRQDGSDKILSILS